MPKWPQLASQKVQDFKHISLPQLRQPYTDKRHSPTVNRTCWFAAQNGSEVLLQRGAPLADRGAPILRVTAVPLPKSTKKLGRRGLYVSSDLGPVTVPHCEPAEINESHTGAFP